MADGSSLFFLFKMNGNVVAIIGSQWGDEVNSPTRSFS